MKTLSAYTSIALLLILAAGCGAPATGVPATPESSSPATTAPPAVALTPTSPLAPTAPAPTVIPTNTPVPLSAESVWTFDGGADPLRNPIGIAIDAEGNVYIADQVQSFEDIRIVKIDSNGQFLTQWSGEGEGKLLAPSGVAVDGQGSVFVAEDRPNNRVLRLTATASCAAGGTWLAHHWRAVDGCYDCPCSDAPATAPLARTAPRFPAATS